MSEITGATTLAGVIGDPVGHSRSPAIHNAAFRALGLDWVYVAFPVPAGRGAAAVAAMPTLGIAGLSVTMPHKADTATACTELSVTSRALGVVNAVVLREDRSTFGTSTDGEGFVRSVRAAGFDPADKAVLVLGAGGAARAVVHALGEIGATVTVAARRPDQAAEVARLAPGAAPIPLDSASIPLDPSPMPLDSIREHVERSDAVVNATPVGMGGGAGLPGIVPGAGQWAIDLVYEPLRTQFLAEAEARGASTIGGLGMLVEQAGLAFELFTGRPAPLDAMGRAAQGAVDTTSSSQ